MNRWKPVIADDCVSSIEVAGPNVTTPPRIGWARDAIMSCERKWKCNVNDEIIKWCGNTEISSVLHHRYGNAHIHAERKIDRQSDGRTDSWVDPCTQFQVSFFEFNLQEKYEHGFHHHRIIKRKLWGQFGKGLSEFLLPQVHSKWFYGSTLFIITKRLCSKHKQQQNRIYLIEKKSYSKERLNNDLLLSEYVNDL